MSFPGISSVTRWSCNRTSSSSAPWLPSRGFAVEAVVKATDVKDTELDLARQLIAGLAGEWVPEEFENEYRRDLARMLEAKVAGQEITRPEPLPEAPVVDLMEALRASVAAASTKGGGTRKKAPARSSAAAKKTARRAS